MHAYRERAIPPGAHTQLVFSLLRFVKNKMTEKKLIKTSMDVIALCFRRHSGAQMSRDTVARERTDSVLRESNGCAKNNRGVRTRHRPRPWTTRRETIRQLQRGRCLAMRDALTVCEFASLQNTKTGSQSR